MDLLVVDPLAILLLIQWGILRDVWDHKTRCIGGDPTFQLLDKSWSQMSSILPPRFLPSIFIAHRVQQSHCSSISHEMLLTRALALSASQFVHKKKSQRIYTSMHSVGLELTKLTYTRLEDNLIRLRGDRRPVWDLMYLMGCPEAISSYQI